jgi:S-adenosylmethionine/arginine decarboxylase-like enzyme
MTVSAIIETSHIVMHTWDEQDPALVQLDVYTCSTLDLNTVWEWFAQYEPTQVEYKFLDRENGLELVERSDPR